MPGVNFASFVNFAGRRTHRLACVTFVNIITFPEDRRVARRRPPARARPVSRPLPRPVRSKVHPAGADRQKR